MKSTIKEINGRYTCTKCGREWSAMCGDGDVPEACNCNVKNIFEKFSGDGSHCGLTDLYPERTVALKKALRAFRPFTTGWWASKKEIASSKIDFEDDILTVSVSVSDDFDTDGQSSGSIKIKNGEDIDDLCEKIADLIYEVWDKAKKNLDENAPYRGFSVIRKGSWVETYLVDASGYCMDSPPGDNYHKWGFQGEGARIPKAVKEKLEEWAISWDGDTKEYTHKGWTIKPWENENNS